MLLYKYRVKCSKAISGWDWIGSLLGGAKNCTMAIKVHFYKAHLLSVAIRSSIDLGADVRVAVFLLYLTLHVITKHRTLLLLLLHVWKILLHVSELFCFSCTFESVSHFHLFGLPLPCTSIETSASSFGISSCWLYNIQCISSNYDTKG